MFWNTKYLACTGPYTEKHCSLSSDPDTQTRPSETESAAEKKFLKFVYGWKKMPRGRGEGRLRIVSRVITNYVFTGCSAAYPKLFDSAW
jgi:hypothetical protein